jgi:hypothetical protein
MSYIVTHAELAALAALFRKTPMPNVRFNSYNFAHCETEVFASWLRARCDRQALQKSNITMGLLCEALQHRAGTLPISLRAVSAAA